MKIQLDVSIENTDGASVMEIKHAGETIGNLRLPIIGHFGPDRIREAREVVAGVFLASIDAAASRVLQQGEDR